MEGDTRIGTESQMREDGERCAKAAAGQSRRERILRFFGRHHKKQRSRYVSKLPRPIPGAEFAGTL